MAEVSNCFPQFTSSRFHPKPQSQGAGTRKGYFLDSISTLFDRISKNLMVEEELMIIVRDVFQAKYGKGGDLVDLFKEASEKWSVDYKPRILTDLSGQFFTVVTEQEYKNLDEFEKKRSKIFSSPEFGEWFQKMTALVETGKREFLNIES